jgi:hypothetical protein|tara:strand:- start:615 stop:860 length:246 start_codon:yes stop_codon:yes gene_type:complete
MKIYDTSPKYDLLKGERKYSEPVDVRTDEEKFYLEDIAKSEEYEMAKMDAEDALKEKIFDDHDCHNDPNDGCSVCCDKFNK